MNVGMDIARTGAMVHAGDATPFEEMLSNVLEASPFTEENKNAIAKHYKKKPSRYIEDVTKLKNNLPQYGGPKPVNTTNNLVLNLGELSLSQKEKLLKEKLEMIGVSEEDVIPVPENPPENRLKNTESIDNGRTAVQEDAGRGDNSSGESS